MTAMSMLLAKMPSGADCCATAMEDFGPDTEVELFESGNIGTPQPLQIAAQLDDVPASV